VIGSGSQAFSGESNAKKLRVSGWQSQPLTRKRGVEHAIV
jgi:hypothetical protein